SSAYASPFARTRSARRQVFCRPAGRRARTRFATMDEQFDIAYRCAGYDRCGTMPRMERWMAIAIAGLIAIWLALSVTHLDVAVFGVDLDGGLLRAAPPR